VTRATSRPDPIGAFVRDLRRRTDAPGQVVRIVIAYKAATALLLLITALFLFRLIIDYEWGQRIRTLAIELDLHVDNRFISDALVKFGFLSKRSTTTLGVVSLLYALLEATEVTGLILRRRWAEYLVLLATLLFLPYEGFELWRALTILKLLVFIGNVAIGVYFIRAKSLFQDDVDEARITAAPVAHSER